MNQDDFFGSSHFPFGYPDVWSMFESEWGQKLNPKSGEKKAATEAEEAAPPSSAAAALKPKTPRSRYRRWSRR